MLDFPDDKALRDIDTEFLFGDNLLVAPFPGASTSRDVYLPAGVRWYNMRTGEQHEGGTTITVTAQAGDIPVFVRDNCLLPLAEPMPYVADDAVFNITVQVYGEMPVPFELVEDDGISYNYAQGKVNTVRLSWEKNSGNVERQGGYDKERYIITNWKKI